MARKFFVGGNFKMYELLFCCLCQNRDLTHVRNGTKASLDKIVDTLNSAQLDSNVGQYRLLLDLLPCSMVLTTASTPVSRGCHRHLCPERL